MPSTYPSRAIGSYELQAKALSQTANGSREKKLDRRFPATNSRNENEKQSFADILNDVSSKQKS